MLLIFKKPLERGPRANLESGRRLHIFTLGILGTEKKKRKITMTGSDCAVMCNKNTPIHTQREKIA